jgi:transcriptional regulator with XRE-family HTH domain
MDKIGTKIRKLREQKEFTQEYVAKKLDMTTAGYSKIEREVSGINMNKLSKIAKILELDLRQILDFDEKAVLNFQCHRFDNQQTGYIHPYQPPQELIQMLLTELKAQITQLQSEVQHLRSENSRLLEKVLTKKD